MWRRRVLLVVVLVLVLVLAMAAGGCRRSPNSISMYNRSGEKLVFVVAEVDRETVGAAPPEVVLSSGHSSAWFVPPGSCLEGTVEARDAEGEVVASWDRPCGRDQLRVDPPDDPLPGG